MSWMKKFVKYFFSDEYEEIEIVEEKIMDPKPIHKGPVKSPGRIISSTERAQPKMVHKYPSEGKFRFPLIPDQGSSRQQPAGLSRFNSHKQMPISKRTEESLKWNEQAIEKKRPIQQTRRWEEVPERKSKKLDNPPVHNSPSSIKKFKPTEIPSPVYGFGKKENSSTHTKEEKPETGSTSKFVPTSVPSPIYGFGERKSDGIIFPGRENERGYLDPFSERTDKRKKDLEEKVLSDLAETNSADSELSMELPSLISSPSEYEGIEKDEGDVSEYLESPKSPLSEFRAPMKEENTDIQDDIYSPFQPETISDFKTSSYEDREEAQSIEAEEETPHQTEKAIPKKTGGTFVPFNVMMLKKDRQAIKSDVKLERPNHKPSVAIQSQPSKKKELLVPIEFLTEADLPLEEDDRWVIEQEELLQATLDNFNVNAKVVNFTKGPSVTRLEVHPAPGVKVNKITNLTDDIKLSLAARDIRMEAPIPGKNTIGIEVPNRVSRPVNIREIIEHPDFIQSSSPLTVALGLDISGSPVLTDLQKMPHGLIAGATGSGKSVCINSILISLLYKSTPDEVRLLLVDPKMVELAPYNHIPHLVTPVITDAKEATAALKWAVEEMERRYEEFAKTGVRDMKRYNDKMEQERHYANKMPYIVVVIDELADLMMVSPQDVEEAICRIAQKARACGIHLLLATQRPSVDVITGLIKANIPTRAAFSVSSAVDSRTILDMSGAERLLGRGDMLFMENGSNKATRIQGNYVSDEEIEAVTAYVKEEYEASYLFTRDELIQSQQHLDQEDELFEEACFYVMEVGAASSSSLQRRFRIGFNRAARLVEMMEAFGLVSEAMGSKPRNVLLTQEEFENRIYNETSV